MWQIINSIFNRFRYEQFAKRAQKPNLSRKELNSLRDKLKAEGYYSQNGQDKWIVENLFPDKKFGVFVDIGAHDGITFSNTFFLEQKLGWTGLAVEPIPEVYERLKRNRQCNTIQGCVGDEHGKARFRKISGYSEMLSGLVDKYHPDHLKRIKREFKLHNGEFREIEVTCYMLNELLESHKLYKIDYLSIDVEGAEYDVLKGLDFERFHISVIGVENPYKDYRIPKLLINTGFSFHSIIGDEFYVNTQVDQKSTAPDRYSAALHSGK